MGFSKLDEARLDLRGNANGIGPLLLGDSDGYGGEEYAGPRLRLRLHLRRAEADPAIAAALRRSVDDAGHVLKKNRRPVHDVDDGALQVPDAGKEVAGIDGKALIALIEGSRRAANVGDVEREGNV